LTADPRRPQRAYYVYDLRKPPGFFSGCSLLSTTTNGGRSWSAPRTLFDPHTSDSWPGISKILVNRDGSLLDVFALISTDPANLSAPNHTQEAAIRSVDGGRTCGKPVTIGRSTGRGVADPATENILNTFDTYPSQTVAPNGDVYVSWLQPGATNASSRITVARSTDGGRHWGTRKLAVRGQAALPAIEVAGDGTVGVLYYVIARSSRDDYWPARVALATSSDRGGRWSRRAVAGPFNLLTAGSKARACCFLGDYEGITRLPQWYGGSVLDGEANRKHRVDVYFTRITTSFRQRSRNALRRAGPRQR